LHEPSTKGDVAREFRFFTRSSSVAGKYESRITYWFSEKVIGDLWKLTKELNWKVGAVAELQT
jgi:hypothetical protein